MAEWAEQWICTKFCIKLDHSSMETIQMIQKAAAMGNWWLAAVSTRQHACLYIISPAEVFGENEITQVTQLPYSPDLAPCNFWLFSKLKSPLREKRFDCQQDSGKYNRVADGNWEHCVRSQGAYCEGNWGIIVPHTVFLVSCYFFSINVSIFHVTWLDTFWTYFIYWKEVKAGTQTDLT